MNLRVQASIIDFPVFSTVDLFFRKFKEGGVDGVEIVSGVKSRFHMSHVEKLSQKYQLPITSMHQSAWSGVGLYFDERFLVRAKKLGVKTFVFHPLTFGLIDSRRMHKYFYKLSQMQEKYDIKICLENMKNERAYKRLYNYIEEEIQHLSDIYRIATQYNLSVTYDTSHGRLIHPFREPQFRKLFPRVANIHLSSFQKTQEHLPLTMGDFDTKSFIENLLERKYMGLLTLEVYYPKMVTFRSYDFSAISDSVAIIKHIADKFS